MTLDNLTNERPLTTTNLIGLSAMIGAMLALNRKALVLTTVVAFAALTIGLVAWSGRVQTTTQERWLLQNFIGYAVQYSFVSIVAYVMIGHLRHARVRAEKTDQQLVERNLMLNREIVERQLAESRKQHMAELLRAAMGAANELVGADDIDELWQQVVELARERLGIERCAVFVRDELTNEIWGTFGTDMHGNTTDEHRLFSKEMTAIWSGELHTQWIQNPWLIMPRAQHTQLTADGMNSEPVGSGWVVYTRIATHKGSPFAVMSNDAAISGAPLDENQQDVLAVYCSLVGHLVERKNMEAQMRQHLANEAAMAERHRLARDLHDSVSQALFGVVMGANTARQMLAIAPTKAAQPLDYVVQLSEAALAELRALIFELRPESLEEDGLIMALNKQGSALLLRHKIEVELDLGSVEPPIDFAVKEELYRISIESVQNIIKHAQATKVQIVLRVMPDEMMLEISDNGTGFDTSASYPGRLGLISMRDRTHALRGALKIRSMSGSGTTVRVTVPLLKLSQADSRGGLAMSLAARSGKMGGSHESGKPTARRSIAPDL